MQTFLPYKSFTRSAKVLDNKRLGRQRVEAKILIDALDGKNKWKSHPAVKMWKGYKPALKKYHNEMIKEWVKRGFNNNMKLFNIKKEPEMPPWLGKRKFHLSHRSQLKYKDPKFYKKFGWKVESGLPYFWPV